MLARFAGQRTTSHQSQRRTFTKPSPSRAQPTRRMSVVYNEEAELERTQTIMNGAPHCDFRFSVDETD